MQQYNTANNQALALSFNGVNLNPVAREGQIWMTSADLAKALGYKEADSITRVYNRNKAEFSESMTTIVTRDQTVNLTATAKTKGLTVKTRIFSLRGCHLIAMFANTKVAKDFRGWVLDILDREVGAPTIEQPLAITDADWQRYSRSMTIPEMAAFTHHSEKQVVNALHKVMGGGVSTSNPVPVLTEELQQALNQFWSFVAQLNVGKFNHSRQTNELAISIPDVYDMAADGQLPPTHLIYRALRVSDQPRFKRANAVVASVITGGARRVWVFVNPSPANTVHDLSDMDYQPKLKC